MIRTAGISDINTLQAFRDTEQRIADLEARVSPGTDPQLLLDLEQLKADVAHLKSITVRDTPNVFIPQGSLHLPGMVPDPGPTNVRTDRVLNANGEFVSPLAGQLSLVPPGSCGTSLATRIANLRGSLAVTGALRADRISARVVEMLETHGDTVILAAGVAAINVGVWYAPYHATVIAVRGWRLGGTGATVNARRNGASQHLASDLSLTSASTWMDGGVPQDVTYTSGDSLEIMVVSTAGNPTQVGVQVIFQRR